MVGFTRVLLALTLASSATVALSAEPKRVADNPSTSLKPLVHKPARKTAKPILLINVDHDAILPSRLPEVVTIKACLRGVVAKKQNRQRPCTA